MMEVIIDDKPTDEDVQRRKSNLMEMCKQLQTVTNMLSRGDISMQWAHGKLLNDIALAESDMKARGELPSGYVRGIWM
jgi:hypothetical protein